MENLALPDFKPWTNQTEASRYTDSATLATIALEIETKKIWHHI
jgi:hypothetical protein